MALALSLLDAGIEDVEIYDPRRPISAIGPAGHAARVESLLH